MKCYVVRSMVLLSMAVWAVAPVWSVSVPIENASFEMPAVDPNAFPAIPFVDGWTEFDVDTLGSTNTGVFANTPVGNEDRMMNADGNQLAFLGSEQGNGLAQDLAATYTVGCVYRLTVGVGISWRFPPSDMEPADGLELVLYYVDEGESVDIVWRTVGVTGLTSRLLQDVSVDLPAVQSGDPWAGKPIGVAIRAAGLPGGFWDLDNVRLTELLPVSIPIENASFEMPAVDPNAFPAIPFVDGWTEFDVDALGSTNTGVFANTPVGSEDRMMNADGNQLAFLGSEQGNGLAQDLAATYTVGCVYRLTVGVGISWRFPPSDMEPADGLELVLYYVDEGESVDIVWRTVGVTGLTSRLLQDVSVDLPAVQSGDPWAGKPIGVAIRAAGLPGGFWDLDNVRLTELLPVSIPIENASFEMPAVDPNAFPAIPFVDGWTEFDVDALGSTNTGVFANTPVGSEDRMMNADGNQLAFLGSEQGNGLAQDLAATYAVGCVYRLTAGVGISWRFPPSDVEPADGLELVLYYVDEGESVDIVWRTVGVTGLTSRLLQDVSVDLPAVQSGDPWAGKPIGVAIRAAGLPGGFWDLDNVRLGESVPVEDSVLTIEE